LQTDFRDARTVCAAFAAVRDGIYDTVVLASIVIHFYLGHVWIEGVGRDIYWLGRGLMRVTYIVQEREFGGAIKAVEKISLLCCQRLMARASSRSSGALILAWCCSAMGSTGAELTASRGKLPMLLFASGLVLGLLGGFLLAALFCTNEDGGRTA
jgi:hypothetical protein